MRTLQKIRTKIRITEMPERIKYTPTTVDDGHTEGECLVIDWIKDPSEVLGSILDALMEDHKESSFYNVQSRVTKIYVDIMMEKKDGRK